MAAARTQRHPWPEKTAAPTPSYNERHASTSKQARQIVADQDAVAAAKTQCEVESANDVLSCFPTADVEIPQHQWATFVWNTNVPAFVQTERVDIYLFHGDSLEQIFLFGNQLNLKGQAAQVTAQVNDSWWGDRGSKWAGQNISYPFYWLITPHGEPLDDGRAIPQTTFSAIQTTFADSVVAAMLSSSESAASASAALTPATITTTTTGSPTVTPGIQSGAGSSPFPHYAIVIIVLGIVAVAALCGCMLFAIHRIRRQDARDVRRGARARVRSRSPSMREAAAAPGASAAPVPVPVPVPAVTHDASAAVPPPAAGPRPWPFSGVDAAIMADAFRAELRQRPPPLDEEEEEEAAHADPGRTETRSPSAEGTDMDIRSVKSARHGVAVESSTEGAFDARPSTATRRDLSL
ncbi:hypothetical protein GGX14DRAFT_673968 [Mycena pura]|uniref:Uncharacterized protein n=1 Tax=Mycena pura TaxID=153505 RepID=A0AAD6Y691_9AGAR|nr:hypothetical protein GGX14DRAFT_673968 [Mycena pura]